VARAKRSARRGQGSARGCFRSTSRAKSSANSLWGASFRTSEGRHHPIRVILGWALPSTEAWSSPDFSDGLVTVV
jgi:hypothetical protein